MATASSFGVASAVVGGAVGVVVGATVVPDVVALVTLVAVGAFVVALVVLVLDVGALVVGTPDGLDTVGGGFVEGFGAPVEPEPHAETTERMAATAKAARAPARDCCGRCRGDR